MEIKVEKNVPIPLKGSASSISSVLRSMEVGDSFLVPEKDRLGMTQRAIRAGCKVVTRKEGDKVRVWKVAA